MGFRFLSISYSIINIVMLFGLLYYILIAGDQHHFNNNVIMGGTI